MNIAHGCYFFGWYKCSQSFRVPLWHAGLSCFDCLIWQRPKVTHADVENDPPGPPVRDMEYTVLSYQQVLRNWSCPFLLFLVINSVWTPCGILIKAYLSEGEGQARSYQDMIIRYSFKKQNSSSKTTAEAVWLRPVPLEQASLGRPQAWRYMWSLLWGKVLMYLLQQLADSSMVQHGSGLLKFCLRPKTRPHHVGFCPQDACSGKFSAC